MNKMKKVVVGILAHVDSGKTTLSEAMMFRSGNINKFGRVDHGSSFLDNHSLERERGITIFSKQAVMNYGDTEFTLLDTPGHADFSAETERTLGVLDYALLVISASDGIQGHTMTLWRLLQKYRVPCFIFVNKMDLDAADKEIVLAQLRDKLNDGCVDFTETESEAFTEALAVSDEQLLEKYDSAEEITDEDISAAVRRRSVFPCMFGSALKLEGIDEFLQTLERFAVMPQYQQEFGARVFKISEDKNGGRLTFMKITGGTLRVRDVLESEYNKTGEKVSQIRIYSGEKFTVRESADAGTVCAVTGISFTRSGQGLGKETDTPAPVLEPVLSYTLELPEGVSPHTVLEKMRILEAEDPQLSVVWDERHASIQVRLMGQIQLEILKRLIPERFGFEVSFGRGSIIYKETITDTVEGIGHFEPLRHYAEVHLILKPGKRDSGIVYNSICREEQLDRNYQRLVISMLYEKNHVGVLTGSPITDMEITLAAGRAHLKHTEGGDFREAACRALRQGLRCAKSILLEPYYDFTLEVPSENTGRALSDIDRLSGSFEPPETIGEMTLIRGRAPAAAMNDYGSEVVQYTRGRGHLSCTFSGYDICHNSEEVIEKAAYDPDSDTENPCDSVFCSHGAGHTVKWNEVRERMHLSSVLSSREQEPQQENDRTRLRTAASRQGDIFAADKELMQIFENTYGPVRRRSSDRQEYTYGAAADKSSPREKSKKTKPAFTGKEYVLVDGYNVIFSWEELKKTAGVNLDAARNTLVNILCNYRGYKKCELILVFDAYKVRGGAGEVEQVGGISIVYTKEAETADMYIEKVSHQLSKDNRVRVVTSDGMEQLIILGGGALRVSSAAFLEEVRSAEREIREILKK